MWATDLSFPNDFTGNAKTQQVKIRHGAKMHKGMALTPSLFSPSCNPRIMNNQRRPNLLEAFVPILVLIALLALNVVFFGEDSSYGPNQIALLLGGAAAVLVSLRLGIGWQPVMDAIRTSISSALEALIILLLIGALAGTWLISGVVPAMIVYGLDIMSPTIFLLATCVICAIVSVATGSSWSTVATVGVALLGIGKALGIAEGWIAGAIISGAYFGDKMSPLSDTTNLAPAVAGTDLFTHIRYMAYTTVPSISIALVVFLIAGFTFSGGADPAQIDQMQSIVRDTFYISPVLFLVPAVVIFLIVKKMPAIPALLIGSLLGALCAIAFQPEMIRRIGGSEVSYATAAYSASIESMALNIGGYFQEENNAINALFGVAEENQSSLLKAGGMEGMLNTVWLILCAMIFGGAMQAAGLLRRITEGILSLVRSTGSLIASTSLTTVFFNITASDQYLAIVVPGKMYKEAYADHGLKPENLSRTLEDSGTVTSVLIPWNTCGVAQSGVLGVAVGTYLPYCIFNLVSPLMTMLFGFMGWKIRRFDPPQASSEE